MPDTKISAETAATALAGTEVVLGVQSAVNVKISATQVKTFVLTGGTLTGALNDAPTVTIASAATVAIGAAAGNTISVTGVVTITAFDSIAAGTMRRVVFAGALILTHNATSLILPTAANITTAAGDAGEFLSLGSGNWRCTSYQRASGAALTGGGGGGSTQGKHAIPIMASAMRPSISNGCAYATTIETAINQQDLTTLDYDSAAAEQAIFAIPMPKKWNLGTITAKFYWSHAVTTTNFGVVWSLQAIAFSDLDLQATTTWGTLQQIADTGGTTNNLYVTAETPAITVGGSPAAEDIVYFRLARVPSDGSDTMAIDARLHSVVIFVTTNADTDA